MSNTVRVSRDAIQKWWTALASPERACSVWLGKHCVIVAWLGLLLAVASPPDGYGVSVCWLERTTGIPCLGCGLTRSLSCALRGMFLRSWQYHPMGIFILALFLFTALQSILPELHRIRMRRFLEGKAKALAWFYVVFVTVFVLYGSIRALYHLASP